MSLKRHKLVFAPIVQELKMFPVAPTGGPVPPVVVEAKARRRKERRERNLKGIQDDKVRKERLENRKRLKEQVQEEAEDKRVELQRMDALTQLKVWLGRGLLRFHQVQNVSPGWIFAYETGEGQAMSVDQYRMYEQAAQMGLPIPKPPVWWQIGLLAMPDCQGTLSSVGFDQFVNFFGEEQPRWAMEIPVAMELGLFVSAWVNPVPLVDSDWEKGGAGPFLMGVSAPMIEEAQVDPAAAALNEQQEKEAKEYTANRLQKEGVAEEDRHLPPPPPVLEVEVPPSGVKGGDEAMQEAPPAATTEKEDALFYYAGPILGPPLEYAVRKVVESIAAFAIQNEKGDTEEQKIELFLMTIAAGVSTSPQHLQALRNMRKIYFEIALRPSFDKFMLDVINNVVRVGPPEGGWPKVAAPVAQDPPPPPGLTVAQVQQATAQKLAAALPPAPQEYHSIVDYMKTTIGRVGVDTLVFGAGADFKSTALFLLPSITMREKVFIVRIGREFAPGTRPSAFFSDNQNPIDEPSLTLGAAYGNPPSFTMESVFIKTVKANGNEEFSVAADEPESFGLFGHKQMQHLYEHLFLKAKPLFSVAADKALQFFPDSYVCSNVWWWESKLEMLPIGTSWKQIGRGGFNFAYKLVMDDREDGDAALAFLPPAYVSYGNNYEFFRKSVPSLRFHGLIKRVAWAKPQGGVNMTHCLRELYIAGYAASCGVGPKILAAYVQPGGTRPGYVPGVRMNPGDPEERFANPLYEPKQVSKEEAVWDSADSPPEGWFRSRKLWSDTVEEHNEGKKVLEDDFAPSYNLMVQNPGANRRDPRSYDWKKMVVVMEAYEGDMQHFIMPHSAGQRKKTVEALMKTFYKMGEAGILHCDIKAPNVVYRTWSNGKTKGWSNIETMAIDFDPEFVKVVPWLPGPVIALINAACFFAWDTCFRKARFQKYTMEPLKKLHKEVMDNYPDGVAEAFRALTPDAEDIPFKQNDVQPGWLSSLFNDESEAAQSLHHWVRMYLIRGCDAWKYSYGVPPNASMLARLLAMAQHGNPARALDPPDAAKRGNFPFELHPDPQVRMKMAAQASTSVWGGMRFDSPQTSSGWDFGWDSGEETEWDSDGDEPEHA